MIRSSVRAAFTQYIARFTISGKRGKPSSGIYVASFSCGIAIDKRGEDAVRDAFVRFVRPQPVKIAVSVVSKG